MKKTVLAVSLLGAILTFTSCGSANSALSSAQSATATNGVTNTTGGSSLLSSLSGLFSSKKTLSTSSLEGTWKYKQPSVSFESQNVFKQLAASVASNSVESKLTEYYEKIGIKKGSTIFNFKADGTYTATIDSKTFSGTYLINQKNNTVTLKIGSLGLLSVTAYATVSSSNLSLTFDADRIKTLAATIGGFSSSAVVTSLSALLNSYDGMQVGFLFNK